MVMFGFNKRHNLVLSSAGCLGCLNHSKLLFSLRLLGSELYIGTTLLDKFLRVSSLDYFWNNVQWTCIASSRPFINRLS